MSADVGSSPWTVVYDGQCRVCIRSVSLLDDWDRHGRFERVAFQSAGVPERFPDIAPEEFRAAVQLIGPRGERFEGADAVEKILQLIPRTRPLAWLFRVPLVRPLARRVYRIIARNRGLFACDDHCGIA